MIAITDVHYGVSTATAAVVVAGAWTDGHSQLERTTRAPVPDGYQPGAFYLRELPLLLAVLDGLDGLATVIVDGYVWLDAGRPGLGGHLWRALGDAVPVVGVAKSRFAGASAIEVRRGTSARPLHVTAAGIDATAAAALVTAMHGAHRLPTLLQRADHLARGRAQPASAGS